MINDAVGGGGAMQIVGKCFQTQRRMRQYVEPKVEVTPEKNVFFLQLVLCDGTLRLIWAGELQVGAAWKLREMELHASPLLIF